MASRSCPLRVLVVDDEPLLCWSVTETLGECGDLVTEARTGAAAIQAIFDGPESVDVVLMNDQLPDVRAMSLLSTVRRLSPASRVIVMSEDAPEIAEEAHALGASRVVTKPIDMRDVTALVHDVTPLVVRGNVRSDRPFTARYTIGGHARHHTRG